MMMIDDAVFAAVAAAADILISALKWIAMVLQNKKCWCFESFVRISNSKLIS